MNRIRQLVVVLGFLVLTAGLQTALAATPPPSSSQGGANTFIEPPPSESGQNLLFQKYGIEDYTGITGANGSGGIAELNAPNDVGNIFATMWAGRSTCLASWLPAWSSGHSASTSWRRWAV